MKTRTHSLTYEVRVTNSNGVQYTANPPLKYTNIVWQDLGSSIAIDTQKRLHRSINQLDFFAKDPNPEATSSIFVTIISTVKNEDTIIKTQTKRVELVDHRSWYLSFLDKIPDTIMEREKSLASKIKFLA